MAANSVDSDSYVDGSIDAVHLSANSVDSDAYVDGSIDTAHIDALQVTGAKLNTDVISAQTELAVAPADADEFMVSDGGVLKRIDYSLIKGAGKVLQVVQSTTTSSISTDSTSFAATGFTSSITPTASDSKILIQVAGGKLTYDVAGRIDLNMYTQTNGGGYSDLFMILKDNNQSGSHFGQTFSNAYLHSPTTTSQVDYQMYFKVNEGTVYINDSGQIAVTMLEIAA
jgi:hypothetical protein